MSELRTDYPWLTPQPAPLGGLEETGWRDLIAEMLADMDAVMTGSGQTISVLQVKEKFGGLRFYFSVDDSLRDALRPIIDRAEQRSFETCFTCGAPGTLSTDGWIIPCCKTHAKKQRKG